MLDAWRAEFARRLLDGNVDPLEADAEDELVSAGQRLAQVDTRSLSDDELISMVRAVETAERAIVAARGHALAELEQRGTTERTAGLVTRSWLASEFGIPRSECSRQVRVASRLRRTLPLVDDALADGRLSFDHARLLCDLCNPRVVDSLIELQQPLIDLAADVRFEVWARDVRDLISVLDSDGGHQPEAERSHLSLSSGLLGELVIKGVLHGEAARTVEHALRSGADRLFHRSRRDQQATPDLPAPSRNELLAAALVELVRCGNAAEAPRHAPAADVTLVVQAAALASASTTDGALVDDASTTLLMCDPVVHALVVDSLGVPLDLGRSVRFATKEQRRAASVRDGGCVFPGCDAPPTWCDLHHVEHAEDGGPTDLWNLASLCRHHHGISHRQGWQMRHEPDQWFSWVTPGGTILRSQRHGRRKC